MRRLITLLIAALIAMTCFVLSSCSPETRASKHIRKGHKHFAKARILDPSAFRYDTTMTVNRFGFKIPPIDTNYLRHLKPRVVHVIDSALKDATPAEKEIIYRIVEKEVKAAPTAIKIDTTMEFDDGSKVRIQFNEGKLEGELLTTQRNETAVIKETFWQTTLGKVMIAGGILFVVLALMRFVFKVV